MSQLFLYRVPDPQTEHSPLGYDVREEIWKNVLANFPSVVELSAEEAEDLKIETVVLSPRNGYEVKGDTRIQAWHKSGPTLVVVGPDNGPLRHQDIPITRTPDAYVFIPVDTRHSMWSFVAFSIFAWEFYR